MKYVPNTITCLNLFSGCLACVAAFNGNYAGAALFIGLAAVFDFLDGLAARLLHAYSAIGKELDSLADLISFGLAPGLIVFSLLGELLPPPYFQASFAAFLLPIFSALRLAKFNVDERQTTSFIGLPTPANAIFFASLAVSLPTAFWGKPSLIYAGALLALTLIFCGLLVSEIPMFSLKMKNFSWRDNRTQYVFLAGCAALLLAFRLNAIPYFIVWYLLLSIGTLVLRKNKNHIDS